MVFNNYGSGHSERDSMLALGIQQRWSSFQPHQAEPTPLPRKSSSFVDLAMGRCTLDDVMQEFRLNGSDSPYNPDEEVWSHRADDLIGMGPSGTYLRQKSWPDPERSPSVKLPRPNVEWLPSPQTSNSSPWSASASITPPGDDLFDMGPGTYLRQKSWPDPKRSPTVKLPRPNTDWLPSLPITHTHTEVTSIEETPAQKNEVLTEEQYRVLSSLPDNVVYSLLRQLEQGRDHKPAKKRQSEECRFCKNNGERESFYRAHALKDARGRVACPVLRAFTCPRCGAAGDRAHTVKYCPLSTNEERIKSAAMMRSVRMASGRRRAEYAATDAAHATHATHATHAAHVTHVTHMLHDAATLDPEWAALARRLML